MGPRGNCPAWPWVKMALRGGECWIKLILVHDSAELALPFLSVAHDTEYAPQSPSPLLMSLYRRSKQKTDHAANLHTSSISIFQTLIPQSIMSNGPHYFGPCMLDFMKVLCLGMLFAHRHVMPEAQWVSEEVRCFVTPLHSTQKAD